MDHALKGEDNNTAYLGDLLEAGLAVRGLGGVHLVAGHDELFHPEGVGQQGVLTGLAVLRDTGLELTHA